MHLTEREKEILNRVANGQKQETIAAELCISVRTVEFHLANVRKKTAVHTTLGAILFLALKPVDSHSCGNPQLTLFE